MVHAWCRALDIREYLRFIQVYQFWRCEVSSTPQKLLESPAGFRGFYSACCVHEKLVVKEHPQDFEISSMVQGAVQKVERFLRGIKEDLIRFPP